MSISPCGRLHGATILSMGFGYAPGYTYTGAWLCPWRPSHPWMNPRMSYGNGHCSVQLAIMVAASCLLPFWLKGPLIAVASASAIFTRPPSLTSLREVWGRAALRSVCPHSPHPLLQCLSLLVRRCNLQLHFTFTIYPQKKTDLSQHLRGVL